MNFAGFPQPTRFIQERFETLPVLESYRAVEQCSFEYRPETGASIEPHIDDCWIWGERIVHLNCLSDITLTLTPYQQGEKVKYNLADMTPRTSRVSPDPLSVPPPASADSQPSMTEAEWRHYQDPLRSLVICLYCS